CIAAVASLSIDSAHCGSGVDSWVVVSVWSGGSCVSSLLYYLLCWNRCSCSGIHLLQRPVSLWQADYTAINRYLCCADPGGAVADWPFCFHARLWVAQLFAVDIFDYRYCFRPVVRCKRALDAAAGGPMYFQCAPLPVAPQHVLFHLCI